jgi:membrane-associated protease RseP (regulator of RpoE activity)
MSSPEVPSGDASARRLPPALVQALVHGGLLLATFVTMTAAFSNRQSFDPYSFDAVVDALFFSVPALLILGSHELGHYFMARAWGVESSLPYFIPMPLGFGTLGAVIRLKGKIPSRDALFDIGAGGPLAGLAIALPMLVVGVMLSQPMASPAAPLPPNMSLLHFGVWLGQSVRHWLDGVPMPEGSLREMTFFGDNLLTLLVTRAVWGKLPVGTDLGAHPVFIAAWFGLVVTMLNLLPVGQLDGGHVMRARLGPKAEQLGPHVVSALLVASLFSASWLVWVLLVTRVVGFGHPPPTDDEAPLSPWRRRATWVVWALTLLTFIPVPVDLVAM